MRQAYWLPLCGMILLVGCATQKPPPLPVPPLPVVADPAPAVEAPPPPIPAEDRSAVLASEPPWIEGPPLQVSRTAAKLATMKPALAGFDRGMLVYPYRPYAIYWAAVPLWGALHIQLQPGESIRLVAGLRESDWLVQRDDAITPLEVSHLAISAKGEKLQGQLTLITSWRIYYLKLYTHEISGLYGVSWQAGPPPAGALVGSSHAAR